MGGFLLLLVIDIATSRNTVEPQPVDLDPNGIPGDFPNDEESRDMFGNRDLGDA